ncbi:MAG TPA: type II toxin-antitoxin system VapC family toxin [Tepidisphaeraceae bacterium]|nr:type II toxin-antitoxin system VapC family toxin [Tepidisphaeraceae bacterium]
MIYVLDTDILSLLAHKDSPEAPRIRRRIVELPTEDLVATTVINYEEQMRGWMGALRTAKTDKDEVDRYRRLLSHLEMFRRLAVLPYDAAAAAIASQIRKRRLRIGEMDLKIASIVLAADNGVLVTRNIADFGKLMGLDKLKDWSREGETGQ